MSEANLVLPRLSRLIPVLQDRFRWLNMNRPTTRYLVREFNLVDDSIVDPHYFRTLIGIRRLIRQADDLGVQIKDIGTGLVDFPARLHGRDILLCWRIGESKVRFWHDPEAGFVGRHPLPDPGLDPSEGEGDGH
ncbi:MAG: DUF2203 domain-containing protein [Acidobacteriota bacterium]